MELQPIAACRLPADLTSELSNAFAELDRMERRRATAGFTIQNVVGTFDLKCPINLKEIAQKALNVEYSPKRFSAVVMRQRDPRTTALIFSTGKAVITGAKTPRLAHLAARKIAQKISKLVPVATMTSFKIQNVVANFEMPKPLRLILLSTSVYNIGGCISYEPELFPGLHYRLAKSHTMFLIFASGRVVITGARSVEDSQEALDTIYPVLLQFQNNDPAELRKKNEATARKALANAKRDAKFKMTAH
jgi:transcription initiation factor TFIID TATA-box-binding protein